MLLIELCALYGDPEEAALALFVLLFNLASPFPTPVNLTVIEVD